MIKKEKSETGGVEREGHRNVEAICTLIP